MDGAAYYKCGECGYEFLSKVKSPVCPHCKSTKLENKDIRTLARLNE